MAYSFINHSCLVTLFFLVMSQFITLSSADLISDVCKITLNPKPCDQDLRSAGGAGKDLKGLGEISIDLAKTNAKKTSNDVIAPLLKIATDPSLKDAYSTCAELYQDAIDDLDGARQALESGDIDTFRTRASAALDEPGTCEDGFTEGSLAEAPELKSANIKLERLCGYITAIGSKLAGN